ncbi:MAG: hypothetical protein J1E28_04075 [Helicobacter sp.]|uniref:hypothetical protein n=1 Tax=Helicobacter sp. TaxID=218 RepID=UPI0025C127C7|nr:hypothetical protein [Helicobacter sp.]MCH5313561.1 hypothetical protein [Helicobacter sp.]
MYITERYIRGSEMYIIEPTSHLCKAPIHTCKFKPLPLIKNSEILESKQILLQ